MIKVLLKSSAAIRLKSLTSSYHKCFNEKCLIECEVNSLDSVRLYHVIDDKEAVDKIDSSKIRVKGVRMRLESYDSHSNMRNIRYQQSSLPTVLLLPNGESDFRAFDYLIGSLVEQNFRVLAFKFPGFGKSKLVKNDPIYDLSIKQRVCIVHDFLHYFLPDRKIALNSVIGFGENSTLIPFVSQAFGNTYPGHKSTVMVNPAPPNFISNLKETSLETYFGEHDMTKGIYKKQITKKLVKSREQYNPTFKNTNSDHLFNLYLTYKEINEKLVEFACFNLIPYGKNTLIFLNEDQNVYDTKINEYFKNHSEFESNLHRLPVTDDSDNLIRSITNKCLDLVKNTL